MYLYICFVHKSAFLRKYKRNKKKDIKKLYRHSLAAHTNILCAQELHIIYCILLLLLITVVLNLTQNQMPCVVDHRNSHPEKVVP